MALWMNVPDNQGRAQLDHILHDILQLDNADNEPTRIALNRARARNLVKLLELTTGQVDALACQPTCNAANGNAHPHEDLDDNLSNCHA
jgi:hypothetical protein